MKKILALCIISISLGVTIILLQYSDDPYYLKVSMTLVGIISIAVGLLGLWILRPRKRNEVLQLEIQLNELQITKLEYEMKTAKGIDSPRKVK